MEYYAIYDEENNELSRSNCVIVNMISIPISKEIFDNTERYMYQDGEIVLDPDYEEKQKEKERERISHLKCTKRVLVLILEELGLDYFQQIEPLINSNRQAKLEWELCVELERCNPLLNIIGAQLSILPEQIDQIFKYANGEVDTLEVE